MITICIANQKGGCGKTTTATVLAHGLAAKRRPALVIDLDPQDGHVAKSYGMPPEPCVWSWIVAGRPLVEVVRATSRTDLSIIPGNWQTVEAQLMLAFRQAPLNYFDQLLRPLRRTNLEYIIFDTSPSLGGLQERALYAADLVIVPTECNFLSADAVASTIATLSNNQAQGWQGHLLGILPTFLDDRTREQNTVLEELRSTYPGQVLDPIHSATVIAEASAQGQTIWEYAGKSRAAEEYSRLLYKVLDV